MQYQITDNWEIWNITLDIQEYISIHKMLKILVFYSIIIHVKSTIVVTWRIYTKLKRYFLSKDVV